MQKCTNVICKQNVYFYLLYILYVVQYTHIRIYMYVATYMCIYLFVIILYLIKL